MGLSPEELSALTPFQFELKLKGFREGRMIEENNYRKLAWIVFAMQADPVASKGVTLDDIWPNENSIKKAKEKNILTRSKVNDALAKFKSIRNI